jgi:hypothetical protein
LARNFTSFFLAKLRNSLNSNVSRILARLLYRRGQVQGPNEPHAEC